MSPKFRTTLIKVHAAIAAFCLPIGIMFLATGGLYTAGFEGETNKEIFNIQISRSTAYSQDDLLRLVKEELDKRNIEHPTGKIRYKKSKGRTELKWGGLNKRLRLVTTTSPHTVKLTIKTPGWLQRFMRLHKAEGKNLFKVYAMIWAGLLLILFLSGVVMAWHVKQLRTLVIMAAAFGIISFLLLLIHSIWLT